MSAPETQNENSLRETGPTSDSAERTVHRDDNLHTFNSPWLNPGRLSALKPLRVHWEYSFRQSQCLKIVSPDQVQGSDLQLNQPKTGKELATSQFSYLLWQKKPTPWYSVQPRRSTSWPPVLESRFVGSSTKIHPSKDTLGILTLNKKQWHHRCKETQNNSSTSWNDQTWPLLSQFMEELPDRQGVVSICDREQPFLIPLWTLKGTIRQPMIFSTLSTSWYKSVPQDTQQILQPEGLIKPCRKLVKPHAVPRYSGASSSLLCSSPTWGRSFRKGRSAWGSSQNSLL